MRVDSWKDESGNWKNFTNVAVNEVEFLTNKGEGGNSSYAPSIPQSESGFEPPGQYGLSDDGDIPF